MNKSGLIRLLPRAFLSRNDGERRTGGQTRLSPVLPCGRLSLLLPCALALMLSCARIGMVPNPPGAAKPETPGAAADKAVEDKAGDNAESAWVEQELPDRKLRTRDVDFARAFEDEPAPRDTGRAALSVPPAVHSLRYPPLKVQKRPVRVMLRRNLKEAVINSGAAAAQLNTPRGRATFRGSLHVEADVGGSGGTVIAAVNRVRKEVRLPCTLTVSGTGMLSVGASGYRGALVIVSEGGNDFSIINLINVEDYLRGVVPLEIGNLKESEIEAVKAQAVAARTYTYKKMAASAVNLFDVVSTVADQVYGGANAETETADMALLLTRDMIMASEDEIVGAYYHSTCGGTTANIEEVWGGQSFPYLRSIRDVDSKGRAYCAGSSSFSWTETWSESQLAGIIKRYSAEGKLDPPFKGSLRKIEVRDRFACGRVKTLAVTSGGGTHVTGGDKTRFLLRRNIPSRQILRSANFQNPVVAGGEVTISGSGYGHGIGMCQVGAIERAREGQGYEQILKAYYSGVLLRTVVDR